MKIDQQLLFCENQALSADADATNVIDLGATGRSIGDGNPMSVFIRVGVAADFTTTDETYRFNVTTDDNASLTSDTIVANAIILASALTLGSLHEIKLPQNGTFERYLGLAFDGGGTTPTVTITAWLGESGSLPSVKTYANNWEV